MKIITILIFTFITKYIVEYFIPSVYEVYVGQSVFNADIMQAAISLVLFTLIFTFYWIMFFRDKNTIQNKKIFFIILSIFTILIIGIGYVRVLNKKDVTEMNLDGSYKYDGGMQQRFYLDIKKIQKNKYTFSGTEEKLSPLTDDEERFPIDEKIIGSITLTDYNKGVLKINEYNCNLNINISTQSREGVSIIFENIPNSSGCGDWYDGVELLKTGDGTIE